MTKIDWYERRNELAPGQCFTLYDGSRVELDRRVPGDGSKWYVLGIGDSGSRFYEDETIEPGDLRKRILG